MPSVDTRLKNAPPFRIPREGVVGWRRLHEMINYILGRLGFKLALEGGELAETADGILIRITPDTVCPPPCPPEENGNYVLTATVVDGVATMQWELIGACP